jgi:hypothetical protein
MCESTGHRIIFKPLPFIPFRYLSDMYKIQTIHCCSRVSPLKEVVLRFYCYYVFTFFFCRRKMNLFEERIRKQIEKSKKEAAEKAAKE